MQPILLNPGPVNVSPRVQQALLRGDLCHREAEFSDLLDALRTKLLSAFAPQDYTSVVLGGSGTSAVEAMVSSALPQGKKLLVINNGVYGERMLRMATAHRIPSVELRSDWTEPPDLDQIGARFDLTRERVRQIKEKALHRLRHPSRCDQLRTYSRA